MLYVLHTVPNARHPNLIERPSSDYTFSTFVETRSSLDTEVKKANQWQLSLRCSRNSTIEELGRVGHTDNFVFEAPQPQE